MQGNGIVYFWKIFPGVTLIRVGFFFFFFYIQLQNFLGSDLWVGYCLNLCYPHFQTKKLLIVYTYLLYLDEGINLFLFRFSLYPLHFQIQAQNPKVRSKCSLFSLTLGPGLAHLCTA